MSKTPAATPQPPTLEETLEVLLKSVQHAERLSRSDNLQGFEAEALSAVLSDAKAYAEAALRFTKT